MILTCPECATSYFVDDDRVPPAGRTVKCSSCGNRWRAMPEGAEPPEPPPSVRPEVDATVGPPAIEDDLEFVAAPITPKRKPAKPNRKGLFIAVGVFAVLAALVGGAVVMRQQIAGMVPGTAPLFTALGLPVNTLGLVVEGVKYKAVLQAGRPALAVTGQIRNIHDEATDAPAVRMSLLDREGAVVADYLVHTLNARVPPGGVRYFAFSLPNPPANMHELKIGFDLGAKPAAHAAAAPAHGEAPPPHGEAVAHAPEPAEAKPLSADSPDALTPHEPQH